MNLVTLTSDFGVESEGQGVMEATIAGLCPDARIVHLCHTVTPWSVIDGARQMECVLSVPPGHHVCVVDPGVGSERKGIAIEVPPVGVLIGPDNGVLMGVVRMAGGMASAYSIDNPAFMRQPVSSTFHGRDVFAFLAGHLAAGAALADVGAPLAAADLAPAPYEEAEAEGNRIDAIVLHVNRFGNCILNVRAELLAAPPERSLEAELVRDRRVMGRAAVAPAFACVHRGSALLYPDSYGRIGLALNQGDAARHFGLGVGAPISLLLEAH
jgi:S-adenosylmethionine hydrolase